MSAVLSWRCLEDLPARLDLPEISGYVRSGLRVELVPEDLSCEVSGGIMALTEIELGGALESFLRSVTAFAALTDAVLETHAVREANPSCPLRHDVEALAHDLWRAGFRVGFGPSWTPVRSSGIAVGCRGARTEISVFFREHPEWREI